MDPIQTIGTVLKPKGDYERDAIHIAIMPVIVEEDYASPGDEVKFAPDSKDTVRRVTNYGEKGIGIIDPYIHRHGAIRKGDKVWLFLHPNSVTGMRHHWKHPGIDDRKIVTNQSELWLHNFADRYGMNFDDMIRIAKEGLDTDEGGGDWITANAVDVHSAKDLDDGDYDLFWTHMEAFTNLKFDEKHRSRVGWSCSC